MTVEPLLAASPVIWIHVAAGIIAFLLGGLTLFRSRKGDRLHRIVGRVWVIAMVALTISSLFIHSIRLWGLWSPLHILSLATLYFLMQAVRAARAGRIDDHRRSMQQIYAFAVIGAGAFAFLPGRTMHEVLFGGPRRPWSGILVAVTVLSIAVAMTVYRLRWAVGGGRKMPTSLSGE